MLSVLHLPTHPPLGSLDDNPCVSIPPRSDDRCITPLLARTARMSHAHVPQAEFDLIFADLGVDERLDRLEHLLSEQPQLPDGSRTQIVSEMEGPGTIAKASAVVKRQHKVAIMQALQQATWLPTTPHLPLADCNDAAHDIFTG